MSIEDVERLQRAWFPRKGGGINEAMSSAFDAIGFTAEYVNQACVAAQRPPHGKVVKDAVWGMVALDGFSARLVDCPLFQRLRGVRQLGFSYLVYPSAEHTRFTHSLGTYHVVCRFLDIVDRAQHDDTHRVELARGLSYARVTPPERADLIHAALLHDIGHLPFSHVTEKIFQSEKKAFFLGSTSVDDFLFAAEGNLGIAGPGGEAALAECISLAIVLAPRFCDFYRACIRPNDPRAPLRIAGLIAGKPPDATNLASPSLISSGLDADKIDYLCRDAKACNIPVGIDVARIFLRSAFLKVQPNRIPNHLRGRTPSDEPVTVFVVNASGIDTVEEIVASRVALYHRVYGHQTTRNAERLLARAMTALPSGEPGGAPRHRLRDIGRVWAFDDFALLRALSDSDMPPETRRLAWQLRTRVLPKRACVFGAGLATPLLQLHAVFEHIDRREESLIAEQLLCDAIAALREPKLGEPALRELEDAIRQETLTIRDRLVDGGHNSPPPEGEPSLVSILSIPKQGATEVKECFVLEHDGHLSGSKQHTTVRPVADAGEITKGVGYVLCEDTWRELVFLATRTVIYRRGPARESRIDLPTGPGGRAAGTDHVPSVSFVRRFRLDLERACRRSKLAVEEVRSRMSTLADAGYYDKIPRLAPPFDDDRSLTNLAGRFKDFRGQRGWRVTPVTVAGFVNQLRPALRSQAVDLLSRLTFLDRETCARELLTALTAIRKQHPEARGFLAPLSLNSGALLRMILEQDFGRHLKGWGWTIKKSLSEALGEAAANDLIVLCDDNASSGSQAHAQLLAWCGVRREEWPDALRNERGVEDRRLSRNDLAVLRSVHLAIGVCRGTQVASTRLTDALPKLDLTGYSGLSYASELADGSAGAGLSGLEALVDELREVGEAVLRRCREIGDDAPEGAVDRCRRDALGYGDLRALVVTMFNVPSSTLTALWCPGVFRGEPWVPLFIRRGYLEHLVLA